MKPQQTGAAKQQSEWIRAAAAGAATVLILLCWMSLTTRYNYGGKWTAFYFIGPTIPQIPPVTAEDPYLWAGTNGYDGQTFHIMAHDPWMRYGPPEKLGIAAFRYVRIFVPALAWTLALGRDAWIDPAYYCIILGSAFLGAYWIARWSMRVGYSAALGLTFAIAPATITGVDLMLPDITLSALCAGFAYHAESGRRWKIFLFLTCAALTRETGAILAGSYFVYTALRRRWPDAAMAAAAVLPFLGWEWYVRAHSLGSTLPHPVLGWIPFEGFVKRVLFLFEYPLPPFWRWVAVVADWVALAAIGAAIAMALRIARRGDWTAASAALLGFALAAIFLRGEGEWFDAHAFGRLLTPLLLLAALVYLPRIGWVAFAPMVIEGGRVLVWLFRQVAGVFHGLLR